MNLPRNGIQHGGDVTPKHTHRDGDNITIIPERRTSRAYTLDGQDEVCLPCTVLVLEGVEQHDDVAALDLAERAVPPRRMDEVAEQAFDVALRAQCVLLDVAYDAVMPGLVLRLNYGGKKTWRALYYVPSVAKSGERKGQRISIAML